MEIWRPAIDTNYRYEVSNLGNVRNLKSERILKPVSNACGYLSVRVHLGDRFKTRSFLIHRLVAIAFIPNPEWKTEVNHIDGNKRNNRVENLEWCTKSENEKHAHKTGLKNSIKFVERLAELNAVPVIQIKNDEIIAVYKSTVEAGRLSGVDPSSITKVCKHKRKTAGGYVWQYQQSFMGRE